MRRVAAKLGTVAVLALAARGGAGADWPMYRFDAQRSAASPEELPPELHLQWVREYPRLEPAWLDQPRLRFDVAYEPVAAAGLLFFGSSANDSVTALDAATGDEKWRFHADGPVRFAPAFARGKLYFVSDDGYLYCLDAASGRLLWKFRGGPAERLVLGNARLVNLWVARGAPVVHRGRVCFAAGIWPFEGVFIHCLDAESGAVVWTNDGSGASFILQPHASPAFAGVAPQGYLATCGNRLLVPCGRSVPACFDLATGKFLYYHLAASQKTGGFLAAANGFAFANGGMLFDADGKPVTSVGPAPVITDEVVYGSDRNELAAFDFRRPASREQGKPTGSSPLRKLVRKLWKFRASGQAHIKAGNRLFAGAKNHVEALDLAKGLEPPKVTWQARIAGTPAAMLAAGQRLFVVTLEGRFYCFGATPTAAQMPQGTDDVLVPLHARWRHQKSGAELSPAWRSPGYDDRRWSNGSPALPEEDELAEADDDAPPPPPPRKRLGPVYFRHAFQAPAGARFHTLKLEVRSDEAAVVYLNGTEVWRRRFPSPAGYLTLVSDRAPEEARQSIEVDPALLLPGANAVAVELLAKLPRPDLPKFELELAGARTGRTAAPLPAAPTQDEWSQLASGVLEATGVADGYALVAGLRTGRLAEELARRSRLHVVALDPDAATVAAIRRRLDQAGLLGRRVALRVADPLTLSLPPYFASLVTSERADDSAFLKKLFESLRPYGGAACLPLSAEEHEALSQAGLERAAVTRKGGLSLLTRVGALPGAADWTHQNADPSNTLVSSDERVKLPLGILWFGGSSNERILPRHGHGPAEHVVDGRLFIEGPDNLRAMDIYTGRVLWDASLPGIGEPYDNTEHQPGANAIGSNYVSAPDGIYVACGKACLRLDPATGERLAEFALPRLDGGEGLLSWAFVTLCDDVLVAGTSPTDFESDPEFSHDEFGKTSKEDAEELSGWLGALRGFTPRPKERKERPAEWLARNLNLLLADASLAGRLPPAPSSRARSLENAIKGLGKRQAKAAEPETPDPEATVVKPRRELKRLNRLLLEEHCPLLPRKGVLAGKPSVYAGTASRWLVALDRHTGKVLWTREARDGFLHNAICFGGSKLFCIDRLPEGIVRSWRWERTHGKAKPRFLLLALDLHKGSTLWSTDREVFGTWLAYSREHDVLVQAGRASRDMLPEPTSRLIAYAGVDGAVLWDQPHKYDGPIMLHGDTIIAQGPAFDLLTGEPRTRPHPLTGEEIPWTFARQYGCGTAVGAQHLLTFRSAAAGYCDLARDGGTGNFGGFRSSCTSNLIAAGGLLNAPDYTRTCTCSYQNQTSLALIHTPEVETWTFNRLKRSDDPIRRVGINLAAPGDRLDDGGTLWLDFPSVGGPSPHVPLLVEPEEPQWFTHHSTWAKGDGLKWVAASGVLGARSFTLTLAGKLTKWRREHPTVLSRWRARDKRPKSPPGCYTVRLHFIEPQDASPGARLFSVSLQDQCVIESLDVAREAGGPRRSFVAEFKGIEVVDELRIALAPLPGASLPEPVLCGIEVVGEE